MTDLEKVYKLARILDAKKAHNIIALDLCGATIIADYFIICTANSPAQMHALYDEACEKMSEIGHNPVKCEGMKNPDWALIDFGGVILHIFSSKTRDFYGLDNLWADAVKIDLDDIVKDVD